MDPLTSILILFAVITMIFILVTRAEKKRTEAIQEKARMYGFAFIPNADLGMIPSSNEFYLFSLGYSRRVNNMIRKSASGTDEAIFDYTYFTGGGKNRTRHRRTAYLFHSERLRLPAFALRPEHLFYKIGQLFGYQDIDFKQFPEFSRKFILRGKDQAAIVKLFTQEVISCIEQEKTICVESASKIIIIYWSGKRIGSEHLFEKYETAQKIYLALLRRGEFI
jgi:hypothetical protein